MTLTDMTLVGAPAACEVLRRGCVYLDAKEVLVLKVLRITGRRVAADKDERGRMRDHIDCVNYLYCNRFLASLYQPC